MNGYRAGGRVTIIRPIHRWQGSMGACENAINFQINNFLSCCCRMRAAWVKLQIFVICRNRSFFTCQSPCIAFVPPLLSFKILYSLVSISIISETNDTLEMIPTRNSIGFSRFGVCCINHFCVCVLYIVFGDIFDKMVPALHCVFPKGFAIRLVSRLFYSRLASLPWARLGNFRFTVDAMSLRFSRGVLPII